MPKRFFPGDESESEPGAGLPSESGDWENVEPASDVPDGMENA